MSRYRPHRPSVACSQPAIFLGGLPRFGSRRLAELADTSVRTLQRRLGELGISYSEVVDRARFDVASRLLTETDATSVEIAHAIAYSDQSHFARAFRRLTGISPHEYRAQHRA